MPQQCQEDLNVLNTSPLLYFSCHGPIKSSQIGTNEQSILNFLDLKQLSFSFVFSFIYFITVSFLSKATPIASMRHSSALANQSKCLIFQMKTECQREKRLSQSPQMVCSRSLDSAWCFYPQLQSNKKQKCGFLLIYFISI